MRRNIVCIRGCLPFVIPITAGYLYTNNNLKSFHVKAISDDGGYGELISNWKKWKYPVRPHKSEVGKFLNFLEMLPDAKNVLILGSTPELRDIAFITNKNVTCVDINSNTMRILRNNMKYSHYITDENELLIECDWLKMNEHEILSSNKYDLILAEESINMLPFEIWDLFLDEIFDRLSHSGYFIMKAMCKAPNGYFNENDIDINGENIINNWMKSKYNNDISYLFVHLLSYLYSIKNENDNDYINWNEVIQLVQDEQDNFKWSDKQKTEFFDTFGSIKDGDFIFYCKTEQELRDMIEKKHFYFQDVCYGHDDFDKFKFTPIYVLGKESYRIGGKARNLTTGDQELSTQNRLASFNMM